MVLARRFQGKDEYSFTTPGMEAAPGHPGPHAALLRPWRAEVEQRTEHDCMDAGGRVMQEQLPSCRTSRCIMMLAKHVQVEASTWRSACSSSACAFTLR